MAEESKSELDKEPIEVMEHLEDEDSGCFGVILIVFVALFLAWVAHYLHG